MPDKHWRIFFFPPVKHVKKDERKYYEELLKYSRDHLMLYPYHLSDIMVKGLRITPFSYYTGIMEVSLQCMWTIRNRRGLHIRDTLQVTSSTALSHGGHCFWECSVKRSDGYKLTVVATLVQVVIIIIFTMEK